MIRCEQLQGLTARRPRAGNVGASALHCASRIVSCLLLYWFCAQAFALNAVVDRNIIAANETLRLEISSNKGDLDDVDLQGIEQDFDILARSQHSTMSIINGRTESKKSLQLKLQPRRMGKLSIPALQLGSERSKPLSIIVKKAAPVPSALDNRLVILESEVDRDEAYVGEQIIYTLRLLYAVQLHNSEIESLQASHVQMEALSDRNYQREMNGISYQVTEKRFALFVQRPGAITIPAQQLNALLPERGSRSRFGFGFGADPFARGKPVKLATQPIQLNILDVPATFRTQHPGAAFLPSGGLSMREDWSDNVNAAVVGEPITRTLTMLGKGLLATALPELDTSIPGGANSYPEKPELNSQEWSGGIAGEMRQSVAIIPVEPGVVELPPLEIPWWNVEQQRIDIARLPGRSISVRSATETRHDETIAPPTVDNTGEHAIDEKNRSAAERDDGVDQGVATVWRTTTAVLAGAWLLTLLALWRSHRQAGRSRASNVTQQSATDSNATNNRHTLQQCRKHVEKACRNNDAHSARQGTQHWLQAMRDAGYEITGADTQALQAAMAELDAALYAGDAPATWNGARLLTTINVAKENAVRSTREKSAAIASSLPPLYPSER